MYGEDKLKGTSLKDLGVDCGSVVLRCVDIIRVLTGIQVLQVNTSTTTTTHGYM